MNSKIEIHVKLLLSLLLLRSSYFLCAFLHGPIPSTPHPATQTHLMWLLLPLFWCSLGPTCRPYITPLTCQRTFHGLAFNGGALSIIDQSSAALACWCLQPRLQLQVELGGGCCLKELHQRARIKSDVCSCCSHSNEVCVCHSFGAWADRLSVERKGTRSSSHSKRKPCCQSCCAVTDTEK